MIKDKAILDSKVGIVEWFRPGEYDRVKQTIADLKMIGIRQLRTGISWAEWHVSGNLDWYDWLFKELSVDLEILPCLLYTPPSLGIAPKVSAPPRNPKDFADFMDVVISRYGQHFEWIELWNEPNNKVEYDFTMDYSWNTFAEMIGMAAYWAKQCGKKTLLGGMSPIDPNWLQMMIDKGVLINIDAVGVHGFPFVFDQQWNGWESNLNSVREVLKSNNLDKQLWITEAGFSTWQNDEVQQYEEFKKAISADADRVYWYGLEDLNPAYPTVGGYHLDDREYSFGMKKFDGTKKLLYKLLAKDGMKNIVDHNYIEKAYKIKAGEAYTLITGGAGFVGINLAARLLDDGKKVMVYDNLSRDGVEQNLKWLKDRYPENLIVQIADIGETDVLQECVNNANQVFHFSAQVAVTSSLTNPKHDFDTNIKGTFNLLECIRKSPQQPPLIFASTNKVYGNLLDLQFNSDATRYYPENQIYLENGIDESRPLDFHSPYGCSKGAADQYVLDYARTYGLKTVVFRMSCIYGWHQFGTEDQGWVAHFVISALNDKPLTIYGDGKQVRDILFVDDLVNAFCLAQQNIDEIAGNAFNMGGGPQNAVSLIEILDLIKQETAKDIKLTQEDWRTGDQKYYVSNTSKFSEATGWKPEVSVQQGVQQLVSWLQESKNKTVAHPIISSKEAVL